MPIFGRIARRVYVAVAQVTWASLLALALGHAVLSWALLALAGEAGLTGDAVTFAYYYVTTATTVGYGDLSPVTGWGRAVGAIWVLPGAIALFTALLGKTATELSGLWRRGMNGEGDYGTRTGHTVVLGWQGLRTKRLIELLMADNMANDTANNTANDARDAGRIVLVAKSIDENPLPDLLDFVRADALSTPHGHLRAGATGAASIVVRGEDDDETLAATLAAAAAAPDAHIVAFFEDERAADLITRQCPGVEAIGSLSAELLVRSSRDPGASRVADLLFSAKSEDTAFSLRVPDGTAALGYLDALVALKRAHDITLLGIGRDGGRSGGTPKDRAIDLNCGPDETLRGGDVLYYVADRRLAPDAIDWRAMTGDGATDGASQGASKGASA